MLRRVVVGVDGRQGGADAAALAAALAAPDADLVLAGVYRDPLLPLPLRLGAGDDLQAQTEAALREARDAHAPRARVQAVCDSFPARGLRHLAERERADLLVLGSTHRARDGRAALGRRARQVLQDAPCPVALAARGLADEPAGRPRRVVVGYDGSTEADAALATAVAVVDGEESRIVVVGVADDALPTLITPAGAPVELARWDTIVEERRRHVERLVAQAAGDGRRGAEVRVGDPAQQLREAAAGADLLVIGSRRWGALARIVVGSTAETLMRDAPCSMLLAPRPAQAATDGDAASAPGAAAEV